MRPTGSSRFVGLLVSHMSRLVVLVALAMPVFAGAQPLPVLSSESSITYSGTSPLHDWEGTSQRVTGRLDLDREVPARSQLAIEAPVASFDSGNRTRDRTMREATEADRFPTVRFASQSIQVRSWSGSPGSRTGRWRVTGTLTFHGVSRTVSVDVAAREQRGRFIATGSFPIDLSDYGVDRPGVGPVKIGDRIRLSFTIVGRLP